MRTAVIDFETTGLSPTMGDRATEVAIVMMQGDQVVQRRRWLAVKKTRLRRPAIGASTPEFLVRLIGEMGDMLGSQIAAGVGSVSYYGVFVCAEVRA